MENGNGVAIMVETELSETVASEGETTSSKIEFEGDGFGLSGGHSDYGAWTPAGGRPSPAWGSSRVGRGERSLEF